LPVLPPGRGRLYRSADVVRAHESTTATVVSAQDLTAAAVAALASEVRLVEQLVLLVEELMVANAAKRGDEDTREAASSSSPRRPPPDAAPSSPVGRSMPRAVTAVAARMACSPERACVDSTTRGAPSSSPGRFREGGGRWTPAMTNLAGRSSVLHLRRSTAVGPRVHNYTEMLCVLVMRYEVYWGYHSHAEITLAGSP
jgi:hypothetical protein